MKNIYWLCVFANFFKNIKPFRGDKYNTYIGEHKGNNKQDLGDNTSITKDSLRHDVMWKTISG